jgi:uncharacterized short protein YbdD (DUF466 family)
MRRGTERVEGGRAVGRSGGQWSRFLRVLRRIVGAPDYGAYLEHCRAAGHPPLLSEREYVAEFFEAKGKGVRCC